MNKRNPLFMRRNTLVFSALLFIFCNSSFAQNVGINSTGATPHPSAMLDVVSTTKGLLVPRMSTSERLAIVSPADGLFVFDRDTRTFWFYINGTWNEFLHGGMSITPSGTAGGDLSGTYPSPIVSGIQHLAVSPGIPLHKQIMKWDTTLNMWLGENDSLFLPYNVSTSSVNPIFQITNTASGFIGHVIVGRHSSGSGITFGPTGVWGDHTTGIGIGGSSINGNGVYGISSTNTGVFGTSINTHGVLGQTSTNATAGVKGVNSAAGYGVWGEVSATGSYGIYGSNTSASSSSRAAYFQNANATNTGITLEAVNNGLGNAGFFNTTNSGNLQHTLRVSNAGNGSALNITSLNTGATSPVVDVTNQGIGTGLYVLSTSNGKAAFFRNNFTGNGQAVVNVENNGDGTGLDIRLTKTTNTADAAYILNSGNGNGLHVDATGATTGTLVSITNNALGTGLNSVTSTNVKNAIFKTTHTTTQLPVLTAEQNGMGAAAEIISTKATATIAALNVSAAGNRAGFFASQGSSGILVTAEGTSPKAIVGSTGNAVSTNGIGVWGITGAGISNGIGVLGEAAVNDLTGIGVKGIAGGGIAGGIAVYGEAKATNPSAIGVLGTAYSSLSDKGAVTGINYSASGGIGIYAEAGGLNSFGFISTVGNTTNNATAARFKNNFGNNTSPVVEIMSNGKGTAIVANNSYAANAAPMLHLVNAGTGHFLKFDDVGLTVTTISNAGDFVSKGNITIDGTVTVKTNKGIVRNSGNAQQRIEVLTANVPASVVAHYNEFNTAVSVTINFGTAFSSAPSVYIGNVLSGDWEGLSPKIVNVTTTGCTLELWNYTPYDFDIVATSVKIIAIGPE